MSRWIVVSNRLPISYDSQSDNFVPSSGGLVTAISGIQSSVEKIWVGSAPEGATESQLRHLKPISGFTRYAPVVVPPKMYAEYYHGFSINVCWPLFHYQSELVKFRRRDWTAYKKTNELFAKAILKIAKPNDLVWIHDFHHFPLPALLKSAMPSLSVGFFLHIPWPSSEIYKQLPVREELLLSLLQADLIGFHDYDYLRHFQTSLKTVLNVETDLLNVRYRGKTTRLGVFPVAINTKRFRQGAETRAVRRLVKQLRKEAQGRQTILGIDRLDYTKGIELKLLAFREFLKAYPKYQGQVSLLQIAVPSRINVENYQHLRARINQLVGAINGEFATPNYTPIRYLNSSVSFHELLALYRLAAILLVTSKRDGMNLVSLEYIAAQEKNNPGVLLLSEYTGAIATLSQAVPINPWAIADTAKKIAAGLETDVRTRKWKNAEMLSYLNDYTATSWAKSFMNALSTTPAVLESRKQAEIHVDGTQVHLTKELRQKMAHKRLWIMTDYDGTLVPLYEDPNDARMGTKTRALLYKLAKHPDFEMIVVSGRSKKFLREEFRDIPIHMAAEHGATFCHAGTQRWSALARGPKERGFNQAHKIIQDFTARVPGSWIEKKNVSLSWHYRKSPSPFSEYQARKLHEELEFVLSKHPMTVIHGKKIIECRAMEANKGVFATWFMEDHQFDLQNDCLICIGDDRTDEDLFEAAPKNSITIKVGEGPTAAQYRLLHQEGVIALLQNLITAKSTSNVD